MSEQSPEIPENLEKSQLEEKVMNDFYLSFKFSQQSDKDLHGRLMAYTAREYSIEEIRNILENQSRFRELIEELTIPSQHGKIPNPNPTEVNIRQGIKRQFIDQWIRQCDIFEAALTERTADTQPSYSYHQVSGPENHLLATIAYEMLNKDIKYVQLGRPNRPQETKYESFLQSYGVEEKSTGSAVYDGLFKKLNGLLQNPPRDFVFNIGDKVANLKDVWEHQHPGLRFFSKVQ